MTKNIEIDNLIYVLKIFNCLGIKYWLDGGFGVDLLYGKITRAHRDIDIDYDSKYTTLVLDTLYKEGYKIETDELPVRAELYSSKLGYIDIHPFEILEGSIRQANFDGGFFEFKDEWFSSVEFLGSNVSCISLEGQIVFHSGYELREKDIHDLKLLEELSDLNLK